MMTDQKQKRVRRKVGDILLIDLGAGRHAYAQVADEPLVIFFEGPSMKRLRANTSPACQLPSDSGCLTRRLQRVPGRSSVRSRC